MLRLSLAKEQAKCHQHLMTTFVVQLSPGQQFRDEIWSLFRLQQGYRRFIITRIYSEMMNFQLALKQHYNNS